MFKRGSRQRSQQPGAILFVASPAALGGSNRSLVTLLSSLDGRVDRILASPDHGAFLDLVLTDRLIEGHIPLPTRPRRPIDRLYRIVAGLRIARWAVANRHRLIAIHANALTGLNLAAPAAVLTRKRTVVWVHDPLGSSWGSRLGPILRRLLPDLRCAAVSPTAEAIAVANGLCRSGDAAIVPNPIDPAEVVGSRRRDDDRLVHIGFVGGATERKGFDLLPRIMRSTTDLGVVWHLYVHTTPVEENARTWSEINEFGPELVQPEGKTSDIASIYGNLDVVICPSRVDSFCRVAAEAMMNGLPVVGSDIPPIRRLLGGDEAGILFPPGDSEGAAEAIRRLVLDADLRRRLGDEGRRRAAEFPPDSVTRQLVALYGGPLASSSGSDRDDRDIGTERVLE